MLGRELQNVGDATHSSHDLEADGMPYSKRLSSDSNCVYHFWGEPQEPAGGQQHWYAL